MAQEKVVTTRFIDGVPEGIRVSTSPLSPITTVYMPRNLLSRAKQLGLPKRGLYYLLKNGSTGIKKAYVGQTVKGIQRLNDHNSKKSWWDVAVMFLSNDAHTFTLDVVTGLEKHAIERAITALGSIVENKVDPQYIIHAHDRPTVDKGTPIRRQQLVSQGKLVLQAGSTIATLMDDVPFDSPTAAAQFVYGGSINGRIYFKDANGKSIKDLWG